MIDWLIDDQWLEPTLPWFMPPPPQLVRSNRTSPFDSFDDYLYSNADQLTPSYVGGSLLDLCNFYSNKPSCGLSALTPPRLSAPGTLSIVNKTKKTFNREYQTLACLGTGGFGHAYGGRRRSDNAPVVIKFLPKARILNWGSFEGKRVPYEIEILWRLRGVSGVIRILDHFEERDRFIFVMEKIPNSCTLFDFVMENPSLANTELLRHIFREIVRINITLQLYGVWHRDCKPENILYCMDDRSLRFIDFGSAAPVQADDFREFQGTLEIMVPEWILQRRYHGERACVWTLGICLYFLLYQQYPFRSKVDIVNGRSHLPFVASTDKNAYETMRQCLNGNEHRRPQLNSLQHLSWLNTL